MVARLRYWWQRIRIHPVRFVLIALLAVVIVLIILSILGYIFNWGWTGLGSYVGPPHSKDTDFQRGKTLWDWLQLLIIPAVLAVAGYVINLTISKGEQEATKQRAQSEQEAAEKRAKTEYEIALDNQRETALKEYFDKMSQLLLHEDLFGSDPKKEVREIARIQTLTVLNRLDGKRKGIVVQFLNDSELINKDKTIVDMSGANLNGANLYQATLNGARLFGVDMSEANLSGANLGSFPFGWPDDVLEDYPNLKSTKESDLRYANLSGANLSAAYLTMTNLNYAKLSGANLSEANLVCADLIHADLTRAVLSHADLENANLSDANLSDANLENANLSIANLTGADLTNTVLDINSDKYKNRMYVPNLLDTTMPDGSIHDE